MRIAAALLAFAALGATGAPGAGAIAQQSPPGDDPTRTALAVISPIAAPACQANGSATLLLPVALGPEAGDLALDALGPMFVVCGTLPGSPGSSCELDGGIIGLWPEQANSVLTAPSPVGIVVDVVSGATNLLGLDGPATTLSDAFTCHLPELGTAPEAPPAPPPPTSAPSTSTAAATPTPTGAAPTPRPGPVSVPIPSNHAVGSSAPPSAGGPAASLPGPVRSIAQLFDRTIPGGVKALQVLLAVLLLAYLGSSWLTSFVVARRSDAAIATIE
jgi:hypothetical protein